MQKLLVFLSLFLTTIISLSQEIENLNNDLESTTQKSQELNSDNKKSKSGANQILLKPYEKSFFTILSDNDAYYNPYTDYYYTAGTLLVYTTKEFDFSHSFARFLSLNASNKHLSRLSFGLHQDIYTPIKRDANADIRDFPYGGFLAFEASIANRRMSSLEVIKLQVGMIGPSALAKQTQKLIHLITKNPIFYGWNTQLQNEFALNLYYDFIYRYNLFSSQTLGGLSMDILPTIAIAIGNVATYVSTGSRIRLGYNLDVDFGSSKINTSSSGSLPYSNTFSFYIFAGVVGKYVIRDAFIQGNSFNPRNLKLQNATYNAELGASISYKGFSLSYIFTQVGRGFEGALPYHNFGSLVLNFAF